MKVGGRSTAVTGVRASVRAGRPFNVAAGTSPVGGGTSSSPREMATGSGAGGGASGLLSASISSFTRLASAAEAEGLQPPPASGTGVGTSARTVRMTPPALKADSTGTCTTGMGPEGEDAWEKTGRCGRGASHAASSETSDSGTQSSKPCLHVKLSGPISAVPVGLDRVRAERPGLLVVDGDVPVVGPGRTVAHRRQVRLRGRLVLGGATGSSSVRSPSALSKAAPISSSSTSLKIEFSAVGPSGGGGGGADSSSPRSAASSSAPASWASAPR